jgi:hypothetical protein
MQFFDADDVRRACAEVRGFSQKANWRWKALPILTWEFADRHVFDNARATLRRALDKDLVPGSIQAVERLNQPNHSEIDAYGVTFRLQFKEV